MGHLSGYPFSDDADAIAREIKRRGIQHVTAYGGGAFVCESADVPDRKLICAAVNEYEVLLEIADAARHLMHGIFAGSEEDWKDERYRARHWTSEERSTYDALARLDAVRVAA